MSSSATAAAVAGATPQPQPPPPLTPSYPKLHYISSQTAALIDDELMSERGAFSIDQLMELAGLACAQAVHRCYPPSTHPKLLVAAGPGNQGGDGLVAARHCHHFGYDVLVWYPKMGKTNLFRRLKRQLDNLGVRFVPVDEFADALDQADVVLDSIFGFSFKGEPREPFKQALEAFKDESRVEFEMRRQRPPIVSVDIPSGWDVDEGDAASRFFVPDVLLSLTAPKRGARAFTLGPDASRAGGAATAAAAAVAASRGTVEGATAANAAPKGAAETAAAPPPPPPPSTTTTKSGRSTKAAVGRPGRHFLGGRFVPASLERRFALCLPEYPDEEQIVEVTGFGEMSDAEAEVSSTEENRGGGGGEGAGRSGSKGGKDTSDVVAAPPSSNSTATALGETRESKC